MNRGAAHLSWYHDLRYRSRRINAPTRALRLAHLIYGVVESVKNRPVEGLFRRCFAAPRRGRAVLKQGLPIESASQGRYCSEPCRRLAERAIVFGDYTQMERDSGRHFWMRGTEATLRKWCLWRA